MWSVTSLFERAAHFELFSYGVVIFAAVTIYFQLMNSILLESKRIVRNGVVSVGLD